MDISNLLQTLAILVESAIAAFALLIAVQHKKMFGLLIAVTFGLFILFDTIRVFDFPVSADINAMIFLVGTILMLGATWLLYSER